MVPVTVTIITLDEEEQIAGACRSVGWADEVLVLDCGSSDRTVAEARDAGARTVIEPWQGYGPQRNRAAELARNTWVLALDADERCSEELAGSIAALPGEPAAAAFRFRRRNYFGYKPIRHWPWSWDRTTRLYDRRRARFSTRLVHETLCTDGPVAELAGTLEHYSYRSWEAYRERQQRYANLGARQALGSGRRPRFGDLTLRPATTFLRHYLGRGWLLGGRLGWQLSLAAARGTSLKYRLLREQWSESADGGA